MNGEELKKRLQSGGTVYGTMLSMSRNPRWGVPMSDFGLDYAIIDMEHSPRGRSEVADFLAAFSMNGVVPIVRIPIPDSHYVTMALDAGAHGVLAPYCETVEEVKDVVAAAKWRPLKGALARKVCIIGIESVPAVENLDDILKVEGIDGIFVGPNDLSITLGIPDETDHPLYEATLRKIIGACKAHNTPTLIHHQDVETTVKWLKEGARFVLHITDSRAMHNGFREDFTAIRAAAGESSEGAGESKEVI